jgi:hypothetical protein
VNGAEFGSGEPCEVQAANWAGRDRLIWWDFLERAKYGARSSLSIELEVHMRFRHGCLLAVAALLTQPVVGGLRADDSKEREHPITIIGSASILPVGARCRVELNHETNDSNDMVETVYEGKVAKANDEGITLIVTSVRRKATSQSAAARIPVVKRLFTNVGIARPKPGEAKEVWIPTKQIRAVTLDRHRGQ